MKKTIKYKDGFNMVDRFLLKRRPIRRLLKSSTKGMGASNFGIYMVAWLILSNSENGHGDEFMLKEISFLAGKSIANVRKVIDNRELFNHHNDGTFSLRTLCDVILSEKLDTVRPELNTCQTEVGLQSDGYTPIYAHVKVKVKDKRVKNTATAVKEPAADAEDFDFRKLINDIFDDEPWRTLIARNHQIDIQSDATLREMVKRRFADAVQEKCLWRNGEPYNEFTVKRYFGNWISQGSKSRATLDALLHSAYYSTAAYADRCAPGTGTHGEDRQEEPPAPTMNTLLESIDLQGNRRGPHDELVDKLAEPCPSADFIYDRKKHQWTRYDY